MVVALILIGVIAGIFIQGKFEALHNHINAAYRELKIESAVLDTKVLHIERGLNDTRKDVKAISEREEVTDPNFGWGK